MGDVTDFFTGCEITNVRIIEDKELNKPKGFGYAEFASLEGLKQALSLNGTQFQGRNIRISVADPRKTRLLSAHRSLLSLTIFLQLKTMIETALMQKSLATGAEKAPCPIYRAEETAGYLTEEDSDPTSVENAENAEIFSQREMEKFATSEIGSEKALFHLFLNRSEAHEMEVVHEQMTVQRQRVLEIADLLQLHGVKEDHKARKTMVRDHHDVSSRNDLLLIVLPRPLNRIISGAQRCGPMHQLTDLLSHLATVVRLLHLHPPLHFQREDLN